MEYENYAREYIIILNETIPSLHQNKRYKSAVERSCDVVGIEPMESRPTQVHGKTVILWKDIMKDSYTEIIDVCNIDVSVSENERDICSYHVAKSFLMMYMVGEKLACSDVVVYLKDGRYQCITGRHRISAIQLALKMIRTNKLGLPHLQHVQVDIKRLRESFNESVLITVLSEEPDDQMICDISRMANLDNNLGNPENFVEDELLVALRLPEEILCSDLICGKPSETCVSFVSHPITWKKAPNSRIR